LFIYDGLDCVFILHKDCQGYEYPEWILRGLGVAPGIGNIVATQLGLDNVGLRYYHPNHRGDTAFITNAQGVKDASLVYDAFGRLIAQSGNVDKLEGSVSDYFTAIKFRFSSKEWDADAQLYYFGWYDPDSGTWTTKDPLGFSDTPNCYAFCRNTALNGIDQYGLAYQEFWPRNGTVLSWGSPTWVGDGITNSFSTNGLYKSDRWSSTNQFDVDVDVVLVNGVWYKIWGLIYVDGCSIGPICLLWTLPLGGVKPASRNDVNNISNLYYNGQR
jgi:RHS repeat-associated protein